ncbi:MAG: putative adhesin [Pseudomonadota bacterium]
MKGSTEIPKTIQTVEAVPNGCKVLNVHGHGMRSGAAAPRKILPANVQVAFWVNDGGYLADLMNNYDGNGNPTDKAVELETVSVLPYTCFKLAENDPKPATGAAVLTNLVAAVRRAVTNNRATWLVNTGRLGANGPGVISLSSICSTIGQVQGARQHQWRVNWLCCREIV